MSNSKLTTYITNQNIDSVRYQIAMKQGNNPYYGTVDSAASVITDMDNYPYNRFFRGEYNSPNPIVFEREAGWRPVHNTCYTNLHNSEQSPYPNHCFEGACSSVYPCYPKYLTKIADRESLNIQLNRACIVQYR